MNELAQWFTFRKELPPDAANPTGRKSAPRWGYLALGSWLLISSGTLIYQLNSRWPSDSDLAVVGTQSPAAVAEAATAKAKAEVAKVDLEIATEEQTNARSKAAEAKRIDDELAGKLKVATDTETELAKTSGVTDDAKLAATQKVTELRAEKAKSAIRLAGANDSLAAADLQVGTKKSAVTEALNASRRAEAQAKVFTDAVSGHTLKILLMVMLLGALGGQLHAITSFSAYWANQTFVSTWTFYYLIRPLVGALLALVIYLCLLGGVLGLSVGQTNSTSNLGIGAACFLTGLCSEMAIEKLIEMFRLVFQTEQAKNRSDPVNSNQVVTPVFTKLDPSTVSLAAPQVVKIQGSGFTAACNVFIGAAMVPHNLHSLTELELPITSLPRTVATHQVTVVNDAAKPTTSAVKDLTIIP